ncbi:hypothetical protein ABTX34_18115 [Streptomyces sp. NPDC096538]|uniref:hypothetical protein n=1 Tax=unclassified Streptomyces TaxID=2593676 RepID=UPI00208EF192|nr:hypothetical protein [Streptomyces sp. RO-S4]MCO4695567.1 hypothetical protein [Streptomyces sp. RO-S4]
MSVKAARTRTVSHILATVLMASALTGCSLMELARDCDGTDARVAEVGALGILDSRPDRATVTRGSEEDAPHCYADSGDVVVSAGRTYAFPGTRAEVAAHYRAAARQDGWRPDPEAEPGGLGFAKDAMHLRVDFTKTGYGLTVLSYE